MILIAWFIPMAAAAAGQLASYFISRGDVARQNRYNSPAEQIKRLRKSGLPLAGSRYIQSQQTSLPDTSGIQGAANTIGSYLGQKKIIQEIKNLDANTAKTWADALISDTKGRLDIEISNWLRDSEKIGPNYQPKNNLEKNLIQEQQVKLAELAGRTISNRIAETESDLKEWLADKDYLTLEWTTRMDNAIRDLEIKNLLFDSEKKLIEFRNNFLDGLTKRRKEGNLDPNSFRSFMGDLATMIILGQGNLQGFK